MSRKLRLLILIGTLIMALAVLCSCVNDKKGNDKDDVTTTVAGSETSGDDTGNDPQVMDPENITIKVNPDGNVNFKIIRPDDADPSDAVVTAAQSIRDAIKALLSTAPALGNDFIKRGEAHDSATTEILVGITNYTESASVIKECGYGDYMIKTVGNKIVVIAYSDSGLTVAANVLSNQMSKGYDKDTKVITLKASELDRKVTRDEKLSSLPVFENATYSAYYNAGNRVSGSQCDELILNKTTVEAYDAYLEKLPAAGFTQYTTHEANGNKFATYNSKQYTLTLGFYKYESAVRLLIEPLAPAVGLKADNENYKKVTTSRITMLGLEIKNGTEYTSNGLCVIIRVEDGRFIIVDGGFNRTDVRTNLINTLKEQSADYTSKPVVAAWIITHAHGDHSGLIANSDNAAAIKNAGISIERFLVNFMSDAERSKSINQTGTWSSNEGGGYTNVLATAATFGSTVYKVHVGQIFYFADCEMEILYTLESFAPTLCNAFNTTSTVMLMTFGGKTKYLSTGDATGNGMGICAKMYDKYMQCDIVQVCHHGYTTWGNDAGVIAGYKAANATLVLWPQGIVAFPNYVSKTYNSVLFQCSNYKECYVAGKAGDTIIIELPYVYGQSQITSPAANKYIK